MAVFSLFGKRLERGNEEVYRGPRRMRVYETVKALDLPALDHAKQILRDFAEQRVINDREWAWVVNKLLIHIALHTEHNRIS